MNVKLCAFAGRLCCEGHQQIEDTYGKPKTDFRANPRRVGEDINATDRQAALYFKERARHRFAIAYLQNLLFSGFPCGIIRNFHSQFSHEGTIETAEALKIEYPDGGECFVPIHT